MTPRRLGLLLGLAALAGAGASAAWAQGRTTQSGQIQPMAQDEGRQRIFFNAACTTSSWTLVIASDTISHSTFMMSITSNTAAICLSSSTASGSCTQTTAGPELEPVSSLTDYGHGEWWCESASGTQYIKGYRTRDKGDYGNIGAAGLQ